MTYRQQLRDLAFDTHGVITVGEAEMAGVPAVEVRKLARRGALTQLGYGVYRMLEAPAGRLNEFAEAVALVGPDAVLADEAVLAAYELAHVNLRRIRVATVRRVRGKIPQTIEVVHRDIPDAQRDSIEGVPAMTLEAALLATRGRIMTERLIEATHTARARGLLTPAQQVRVLQELSHP